jgi:hypothetical protein
MLVAAAVVPVPPLLVPAIAGGTAGNDDDLRRACRAAIGRLLDAGPDEIVVVGAGPASGPVEGSWDWRGFGVVQPTPKPATRLPLGLAIGSWLLDTQGAPSPPRRHYAVSPSLSPSACSAVGRDLAAGAQRIGLLVCGDGSARRSDTAPGYLDPAAAPWDARALAALRDADPAGLLALEAEAGARLLAAGRAPWQVLAGAAGHDAFQAHIDWADAPYGVMYIAGTWTRTESTAR